MVSLKLLAEHKSNYGYNNLHKHRNSLLVGNLYLQVPDTDSGAIESLEMMMLITMSEMQNTPTVGTRHS